LELPTRLERKMARQRRLLRDAKMVRARTMGVTGTISR